MIVSGCVCVCVRLVSDFSKVVCYLIMLIKEFTYYKLQLASC